mmetsp:Transcript_60371/g.143887  ORF Transcript_60371/g.143887 Transcript_60371/m.143887 type:complete len:620 (+) Transcript_60371:78-1937(+)
MHRVSKISGHILVPAATAGQERQQPIVVGDDYDATAPPPASSRQPSLRRTKVQFSRDEVANARKKLKNMGADFKKLRQGATELPELTAFDVGILLKHNFAFRRSREDMRKRIEATPPEELVLLETLPGPWRSAKTIEEKIDILMERHLADSQGYNIQLFAKWQMQHGEQGLGSNIVFPCLVGRGKYAKIRPRVVLADPRDAERISRVHVRKDGGFEPVLLDGVIATTDNHHWQRQRRHLSEAFLPLSSLAKIMPVSLARAKLCSQRLAEMAAGGEAVDMSDFLLHEAQAQLQLALLGNSEEKMNQFNAGIRASFAGDLDAQIGVLSECMKDLMQNIRGDETLALPSEGRPVKGPLSEAVKVGGFSPATDYGNLLLILFAGHDTTGHTMTWLMMELARHPEVQRELQREVDHWFASLGGRDPEYRDLASLEFMNRCITETLRLWPAVANGTFRQFQFDDEIHAEGGKLIQIPQKTVMVVSNWARHRNPHMWGPDADEFNPYREFRESEISRVGCPRAAMNPQSERFSPFAYSPRNCLGKNFAMLEARLIIAYLTHHFDFTLAPPYDGLMGKALGACPDESDFRGVNRATMGPKDLEKCTDHDWGTRHGYALKLFCTPRVH